MTATAVTYVLAAICVVAAAGEAFNATLSGKRKYTFDSALPDRLQWIWNEGYCGEVSLIMATLRLGGAYYSQYDAREISAIQRTDVQQKHFYLVGENDQRASDLVKMTYEEFDNSGSPNPKRYAAWLKKMVRAGYAVTLTTFMNHKMFYGMNDENAGYPDYDHIVSMARVESDYDDDLYHEDDIFTMSDHGLYSPDREPIYYFSYQVKDFIATRTVSNTNGHVYSIPDSPDKGNFGIAHKGFVDTNKECQPLLVQTNVNYENPPIKNKSEVRPPAMPLTLTVTVSGLTAGTDYILYTYNDETKVPTEAFNANAAAAFASKKFTATGAEWTVKDDIQSSDKRIYRCVAASAK
jgi:hypothetical protein